MKDILKEICENKLVEVEQAKGFISPAMIKALAEKKAAQPKGFIKAIEKKKATKDIALIAEIKKKSPSKGVIRTDFDHKAIARIYEDEGVTCVSILTDEKYFGGKNEYLTQIRRDIALPILRKDFILDAYQVYESRSMGADCILLIIAALEKDKALELENIALGLGLDVLIEVHDEKELEVALKMKSKLIGVNNRNLKTMEVSLDTGKALSKLIPADYIKVCESGINKKFEIDNMMAAGFDAFLVGESIVKEPNIAYAVRKLLGTK